MITEGDLSPALVIGDEATKGWLENRAMLPLFEGVAVALNKSLAPTH